MNVFPFNRMKCDKRPLKVTSVLSSKYQVQLRASFAFLCRTVFLYLLSFVVGSSVAGEDLNALLEQGQERLRTASSYHVEATITNDALTIRLAGDIAGDDFDLTMSQENGSLRMRSVRNKYWLSHDDGETWKKTQPDRGLFDLLRTPGNVVLPSDGKSRLVAIASPSAQLPKNDIQIVEVRPVPEPADLDVEHLPRYYINKMDGRSCVNQYIGPMIWQKTVLLMDARYSKIDALPKISVPEHVAADPQ